MVVRRGPVLLMGALLLAGCATPGLSTDLDVAAGGLEARPTVIALIDSGINPYHEAFRSDSQEVSGLAGIVGAEPLTISRGTDFEESFARDKDLWASVEEDRLYWFEGTRVFAISVGEFRGQRVLDAQNHGTSTAFLAGREAPSAIIVMVQIDSLLCDPAEPVSACPIIGQESEGMRWVAEQDWIDVVSVSIGFPANPPFTPEMDAEFAAWLAASRDAAEGGKIVVNGAGNTLTPTLQSYYSGPPWVIAVGGIEPAQRGDRVESSRGADVVANHTEWGPDDDSIEGYDWHWGTSFATPVVAGTLAHALGLVRSARGGEPTAVEADRVADAMALRAALNASAVTIDPATWDPTNRTTNKTLLEPHSISIPFLAPGQIGWGYVDGGLAEQIAARVLAGDLDVPPGKTADAAYMAQWQAARERYWATVG